MIKCVLFSTDFFVLFLKELKLANSFQFFSLAFLELQILENPIYYKDNKLMEKYYYEKFNFYIYW